MGIVKKYWGNLRRLRMLHVLFNIKNYGKLSQNKALYRRFGIKKSVVASLAHKDIQKSGEEVPWMDQQPSKEDILIKLRKTNIPQHLHQAVLDWPENGYLIIPGAFAAEFCDRISRELEQSIENNLVDFDYTNSRVMNAWKACPAIRSAASDQTVLEVLTFILGKKVLPFQTISFLKGSRQKTHSDFIHMTTEPVGYLIASWLALEDIQPGSGALHYYPGSHRLPYIFGEHFPHSSNAVSVGDDLYGNYENKIAEVIQVNKLKKEIFYPKKGDLLIWHANLLHGGEPVTDSSLSRKSLVTHYFCQDNILCYHEITQRPAVMNDIIQ
ncbi:MAG: hypothetical protein Fur0041_13570 [Bacteroidia bacterium]